MSLYATLSPTRPKFALTGAKLRLNWGKAVLPLKHHPIVQHYTELPKLDWLTLCLVRKLCRKHWGQP